jgi:hypothetical protein
MVKVGDHVLFIDAYGKEHGALITCVFAPAEDLMDSESELFKQTSMEKPMTEEDYLASTSINVVIVSADDSKEDPYGRQLERHTSIVHESRQTAHGMYWKAA